MSLLFPPPAEMPQAAWHVVGIGGLMAALWIGESLPFAVTALLPVILFPLLGVADFGATTAPYANPVIFLFMGGILIALGMERWGLHRRMALWLLARVGDRPASIVAGFLGSSAFLSMWINNTATAVMMLPIGLSVFSLVAQKEGSARTTFGVALMLAIAYGANIGGFFTLIGTAPNALFAGYISEEFGRQIGFLQWMFFAMPVGLVLLPFVWWWLTRGCMKISNQPLPGAREKLVAAHRDLGPMRAAEKIVAVVFAGTALLWLTRPFLGIDALSDPLISMLGGLSLFLLPSGDKESPAVLDWEVTRKIPWDVLLLIGGGLVLASGVQQSGLAGFIGSAMSHLPLPSGFLLIAIFCAVVLLLTELTSNTATTATFLPILGALAVALGENPVLLTAAVVLAASGAFMLPVATPPNAIVFAGGLVTVPQMVRAGVVINLAMLFILSVAATLYGRWIFPMD